MEWNKWNTLEIDRRIGVSLALLISFSYIFTLLYYFFAFHVFNDSFLSQSILDYNTYVIENFPGVNSISIINEEKYGYGRFVTYMHGVNALCVVPFVGVFSIFIATKQNFWTEYPQDDELYGKDFMYSFLSYLLFGWLYISLLYDVSPHRAWQYKTFIAILIPTGLALYISTIPVLIANNFVYLYRRKLSTSQEKDDN